MHDHEVRARINLALSLLNHRPADEHTIAVAKMALAGASIEDIANFERHVHIGVA